MATPIKVVLQHDVESLGKGGEVVRVRPGYARNFLIPRKMAERATAGSLARVDALKRAAKAASERRLVEAQELSTKLSAMAVQIARTVGEGDRMYGSVTARDVEQAFAELGVSLDRKKMVFDEPKKELGAFEVPYRLHAEVTVQLHVEIVPKV